LSVSEAQRPRIQTLWLPLAREKRGGGDWNQKERKRNQEKKKDAGPGARRRRRQTGDSLWFGFMKRKEKKNWIRDGLQEPSQTLGKGNPASWKKNDRNERRDNGRGRLLLVTESQKGAQEGIHA